MKIKKQQSGVTLVELIMVIAIIAIMAAAVYFVRKPAEDKGKVELTKATIELLCAAVEQYHNFYNEFPDANDLDNIPGYFGNPPLTLTYEERWPYRLSLCPDAVTILNQINPKMRKNDGNKNYVEYIDAWGELLNYEYIKKNKEKDNFPLIRSSGPDKEFGKLNDPNSDDITSRK
jgi:prepilin-type N-terminal cleavage/methylation domain-containing protein